MNYFRTLRCPLKQLQRLLFFFVYPNFGNIETGTKQNSGKPNVEYQKPQLSREGADRRIQKRRPETNLLLITRDKATNDRATDYQQQIGEESKQVRSASSFFISHVRGLEWSCGREPQRDTSVALPVTPHRAKYLLCEDKIDVEL